MIDIPERHRAQDVGFSDYRFGAAVGVSVVSDEAHVCDSHLRRNAPVRPIGHADKRETHPSGRNIVEDMPARRVAHHASGAKVLTERRRKPMGRNDPK
jgi:hypothetical protein